MHFDVVGSEAYKGVMLEVELYVKKIVALHYERILLELVVAIVLGIVNERGD
jgi:hypothetical protein